MALAVTVNTGALDALSQAAAELTRELDLARAKVASGVGAARAATPWSAGGPIGWASIAPASAIVESQSRTTFRKFLNEEIRQRDMQSDAEGGFDLDPKLLKLFGKRAGGFGSASRLSRLAGADLSLREVRGAYYGARAIGDVVSGEAMPSPYHLYHAMRLPGMLSEVVGKLVGDAGFVSTLTATAGPIIAGVAGGIAIRMIPTMIMRHAAEEAKKVRDVVEKSTEGRLSPELAMMRAERDRDFISYRQEIKDLEDVTKVRSDQLFRSIRNQADEGTRPISAMVDYFFRAKDHVEPLISKVDELIPKATAARTFWENATLRQGASLDARAAEATKKVNEYVDEFLKQSPEKVADTFKSLFGAEIRANRFVIEGYIDDQLKKGNLDILDTMQKVTDTIKSKERQEKIAEIEAERVQAFNPNNTQERFIARQRDRYLKVLEDREWKAQNSWNPF